MFCSLRLLDVDDLYILTFLYRGRKQSEIARAMQLSQAAITQRIHKIDQAFNGPIFKGEKGHKSLTELGLKVTFMGASALAALQDKSTILAIDLPAIKTLAPKQKHTTFAD